MLRILVVLFLFSACTFEIRGLSDLPDVPVRPIVTDAMGAERAAWSSQVQTVADAWNVALIAAGCSPMIYVTFDESVPAYPVTLYARDQWPYEASLVGMQHSGPVEEGYIDVKTRLVFEDNAKTLAHEFGHALGLVHAPEGAASVMVHDNDVYVGPSAADVGALCP